MYKDEFCNISDTDVVYQICETTLRHSQNTFLIKSNIVQLKKRTMSSHMRSVAFQRF